MSNLPIVADKVEVIDVDKDKLDEARDKMILDPYGRYTDDKDSDSKDEQEDRIGSDVYQCPECDNVVEGIGASAVKTEIYCRECESFKIFVRGDKVESQ